MSETRVYVGGLSYDISPSDIHSLLSSFKASNIHVTEKGYSFADIPQEHINKCKDKPFKADHTL